MKRLWDRLLTGIICRLLRLSPVWPEEAEGGKIPKRDLKRFEKRMADEYRREINLGRERQRRWEND